LIDDLNLVSARQWGQPGGVDLPQDPIVAALIQEGDPAVEPLLTCLENDKRLTRSVGFGRDFFRGRTVIPVHDAAKVALLSILRAGFKDDAPEIRVYWNKYKNLTLVDRWYAILDDDAANARWNEAAANIVQPENVRTYPGGMSISQSAPTNLPVRMEGEILRGKTNPSVAQLMARRALEVPTNNVNAYDISASCQMALYLTAWNSAASLPVARTLSGRACSVMKYSGQQLGPLVAKLALARAKAGDPRAFDDYASWIVTTSPGALGSSISECLEPFWQFATNQTLQATAQKMFADTNSDWSLLPWKEMHGENPIGSDLVNLPAFRSLLIRELGKTNVVALLPGGHQIKLRTRLPTTRAVATVALLFQPAAIRQTELQANSAGAIGSHSHWPRPNASSSSILSLRWRSAIWQLKTPRNFSGSEASFTTARLNNRFQLANLVRVTRVSMVIASRRAPEYATSSIGLFGGFGT